MRSFSTLFTVYVFSDALTEENLLFLEAWRTVDRAYVDKSFNGQSWFRYREDALRKEPMRTREQTCMLLCSPVDQNWAFLQSC
jgi:carboxyl-terminal processing protease